VRRTGFAGYCRSTSTDEATSFAPVSTKLEVFSSSTHLRYAVELATSTAIDQARAAVAKLPKA
jgi:hypothetical protein